MPGAGDAPSDRLRERAGESRLKLWLFMDADRWLVTGFLVAFVFVTLIGVGYLLPAVEGAIRSGDSVDTLFQALLTATITGVTLVLTLNQLVLSQELGAAGDQRERMKAAMAFREDVADAVGAPVSPSRPAQFLRALVQTSGDRARDLREAVGVDTATGASTPDEHLRAAVEDLTESLIENADEVASGLDDARFGEFDVIASALDFNYSWKIFTARRIQERYGDDLDEEARTALERLIDTLELFGPAREHFKTLYFQWDLIDLSRHILVVSVPALLVSTSMIAFFDPAHAPAVADVEMLVPIVAATTTVALAPFLLLLAYVVRIATVTKHTLSIGPFILRETDDVAEVEWDR
ncbi:hypothetical protein [Halorhabdus amylolytica]|uniref:hypothetical protein n=1 Tax=Halorhabdus amylolytica TaxID=2559573 RepID=UPI0010AA5394|nr:hypothetical protein [Halorhabdus amylolytica]